MAWKTLKKFANGLLSLDYEYTQTTDYENGEANVIFNFRIFNHDAYYIADKTGPSVSNKSYIIFDGKKFPFTGRFFDQNPAQGAYLSLYNPITIGPVALNINDNRPIDITVYYYIGETYNVYLTDKYTYINQTGGPEGSDTIYLTPAYTSSSLDVTGTHILGEEDKITITPNSEDVTHTLMYKCGEITGEFFAESDEKEIAFIPPVTWSAQNPSGTRVKMEYTLVTHFVNGDTYEETFPVYYTIPELPKCTITITDDTENFDKYGGFVLGKSKFKIVVTPSEENTSPVVKYQIEANGETFYESEATTDVIKWSGDIPLTITITDKRGSIYTETVTVFVINYNDPLISYLAVCRCDENGVEKQAGEYVKVTYSAQITALNNVNTAKYEITYGKNSDTELTTKELTSDAGKYNVTESVFIFKADKLSSYLVTITATDDFISVSRPTSASTAITLMNWRASGLGIAFGTTSEHDNVFENAFKFYPSGGYKYRTLDENVSLNDVTIPNTYLITDMSKIYNGPTENGRAILKVFNFIESDNPGDMTQELTVNVWGEKPKIYIRQRYNSAWSSWVCVYGDNGPILVSGIYLMHGSQEVTLLEPVSKQASGIVLIFSGYDIDAGEFQDDNIQQFFVSKYAVNHYNGCSFNFPLTTSNFEYVGNKNITISDTTIKGHSDNANLGTGASGIKYDNRRWVLRFVVGV